MNKTSRSRLVLTILLSISVLVCGAPFDATMFDGQTPIIVGTIRPSPSFNGIPIPLYVVEDGATDNDCYPHRAFFDLDAGTMVYQNDGSRKDTSDLKIGRRVSVFAEWANIKPCMPVTTALGVILR